MNEGPLAPASRSISDGIAALRAAADSSADGDTRIAALVLCEQLTRQVEQLSVELTAGLDRDGVFAERGYSRSALAVADLLGCDTGIAARRVRVAGQVIEPVTLDGQPLPPRLPATAVAFHAGEISLRHVEVVAEALASSAAERLAPQVWTGAEEQLAEQAKLYRPRELAAFAVALIAALDQDGPAPNEHEPPQVNELHLSRTAAGAGGLVKGQLDAPTFDALATAVDALCGPPVAGEPRGRAERQADALGELCRHALDKGELGTGGGERPHLNVVVPLAELEGRARGATLDHGGSLTPSDLRTLACDARVVPVVLGGAGQPLDVGRAMRTVPAHLRRAVAVRDRGCAFPGCDRGPSWCDVHHVKEWQHGGPTVIGNLVMLCRVHHRLLHHPGWSVRIRDHLPEFVPPKWVDCHQQPRRKPPPQTMSRPDVRRATPRPAGPSRTSATHPPRCVSGSRIAPPSERHWAAVVGAARPRS